MVSQVKTSKWEIYCKDRRDLPRRWNGITAMSYFLFGI